MRYKLLLIDDEPAIRMAFHQVFREPDFVLVAAATAAEGLRYFKQESPDAVILDVHLPDSGGLELFSKLHAADARTPILLITGHGTAELAIEAMKQGAYEYLLKPLELSLLRPLVTRVCESSRRMRTPARLATEGDSDSVDSSADMLVGRCPAMQEVYKAIGKVAATDATVLILGESGTGKELVARAIYQHSNRAQRPFLAINCAAIPENLLESELFGHERGAFTGADRKRIGKFEQCDGGTLFLDEIGDMPPLTQAKFLRVLQDQEFERLGGNERIRTNVRILAATNADLEGRIAGGTFRRDLYFRLKVYTILLPPLRKRDGDLGLLVHHFVRRYASELRKPTPAVTREFLEHLESRSWPGNVRELQSVVKQGLLDMRGELLELLPPREGMHAPREVHTGDASAEDFWQIWTAERIEAGSLAIYAEALERMDREVLVRVLQHVGGSQRQAARLLGITRGSLRTKLRGLGIAIGRHIADAEEEGGSPDEPMA